MDKRESKSNIRKGGISMYDINILQNNPNFQRPNFNKFKILLKKLSIQTSMYLRNKISVKQTGLIKDIDTLNSECNEVLNSIIVSLDKAIEELEFVEYENIYIKDLSELENMIDKIHTNLLRTKNLIQSDSLKTINTFPKERLLNITNKNINCIFKIRDKINHLDDISGEARFYVELSKKYSFYKKIFIASSLLSLILYVLSLIPIVFVAGHVITICILILGINKDKASYFKKSFPNINPKLKFTNKENSQFE